MSGVRCAVSSPCQELAKWLPVLLVFANKRLFPGAPPARAVLGVPHCDVHRASANVDDLCTGDGFATISQGFIAKGLAEPDPDVGLDWQPLPGCGHRDCTAPAVVEFYLNWPGQGAASMKACAGHAIDMRRVFAEREFSAEIEEIVLVPEDLRL